MRLFAQAAAKHIARHVGAMRTRQCVRSKHFKFRSDISGICVCTQAYLYVFYDIIADVERIRRPIVSTETRTRRDDAPCILFVLVFHFQCHLAIEMDSNGQLLHKWCTLRSQKVLKQTHQSHHPAVDMLHMCTTAGCIIKIAHDSIMALNLLNFLRSLSFWPIVNLRSSSPIDFYGMPDIRSEN